MKSEMLRRGKRDYRRYVTKWTDSLVARRKKKILERGQPPIVRSDSTLTAALLP